MTIEIIQKHETFCVTTNRETRAMKIKSDQEKKNVCSNSDGMILKE